MSESEGTPAAGAQAGADERFLIVALGGITRVINALPVLHALRSTYPASDIGWAVDDRLAPLLGQNEKCHPELTRLHPVPREEWRELSWWGRRRSMRGLGAAVRSCGYTAVVDLHGERESAQVSALSGARMRVSYAPPEGSFMRRRYYTYRIVPSPSLKHLADRNLSLLVPLAVKRREPRCVVAELSDARARLGRSVRGIDRDYAVLHPGSSWPSKQWPVERYAEVAERVVSELSLRVVVLARGEAETSRAGAVTGKAGDGVTVASDLPLDEMAALVGHSKLFVGCDAGPMHVAWASAVPTVAIFGPTDSSRTGPRGSRSRAISAAGAAGAAGEEGLDCLGCGERSCPRGTDACMSGVSAGSVLDLVREVVAATDERR